MLLVFTKFNNLQLRISPENNSNIKHHASLLFTRNNSSDMPQGSVTTSLKISNESISYE